METKEEILIVHDESGVVDLFLDGDYVDSWTGKDSLMIWVLKSLGYEAEEEWLKIEYNDEDTENMEPVNG